MELHVEERNRRILFAKAVRPACGSRALVGG